MIEGTACSYCGLIDVHAAWCAHEAARRDDLKLLEVIDRQLEIERKARAWDQLRGMMDPDKDRAMIALLDTLAGPGIDDQGLGKG